MAGFPDRAICFVESKNTADPIGFFKTGWFMAFGQEFLDGDKS